jgi:hypothetical protein
MKVDLTLGPWIEPRKTLTKNASNVTNCYYLLITK